MKEKILTTRKLGLPVLLLTILLFLLSILGCVFGGLILDEGGSPALMIVSIVVMCLCWLPLPGLKVLKPQEALVLTLFGRYIGTLKGDGFYFVNPFCTAVNPAAKTRLNQSGDVSANVSTAGSSAEATSRKLSLKIMTLNNNRQKINDCLGNPVEIGIAVTWRIVDTAKAVFNVDNYKEYLLAECVRQRKKNGRYVSDEIDVPPELDLQ